jgi:hypothetical protein
MPEVFSKPLEKHLARPGQPVALPPYCACVSSCIGTHHKLRPRHRDPHLKEHTMDATTTTETQLITCDGCGTQVPFADTYYVDGAGQLCTTTCIEPMPEALIGIEPPF